MRLAFHFHHVHRYLFFPHSENFKICDNALLKRGKKRVTVMETKYKKDLQDNLRI